jgi:hypothetical protein
MKPLRVALAGSVLVLLGAGAGPVHAAWCNVFQVCCHGCKSPVSASYYYAPPAPCCDPCPQPVCTTRYVQRSYYQPVTTYQTRSYYEPVTTYRASYYYEPVTSYRYSCYYDPCTCNYQQVATPVTSYRLRSQCCPVQSWVQRCQYVPVTAYQQAFYYEPVTSCCSTPGAVLAAPAEAAYQAPPAATTAPPTVTEQRSAPPPAVGESSDRSGNGGYPSNRYYYPQASDNGQPRNPNPAEGAGTRGSPGAYEQPMPKASGISFQPVVPRSPAPANPAPPPPKVKLERIVAVPQAPVEGQVVRDGRDPWAGARVLFVSTDRQLPQQAVTADGKGEFRVTLASGGWLVYLPGKDGKPVFHSKIEIRDQEKRLGILASR